MRRVLIVVGLLSFVGMHALENTHERLYSVLERKIARGQSIDLLVKKNKCMRAEELDRVFRTGQTPLTLALEHNNVAAISTLIKHGANVYKTDIGGSLPIAIAFNNNMRDVIQDMQQYGVVLTPEWQAKNDELNKKPEPPTHQQTYEQFQCKIKRGDLSNRFFCKHCDFRNDVLDQPFATGAYAGFTPLTLALQLNWPYAVELLLEYGASPNQEDAFDTLPLEFAIDRAWLETVRLLLQKGAVLLPRLCINIPNRMPLFYYLLKYQCFDQQSLDWMLLGARNHYDIIMLLKHGANIHYKNEFGTTAIENAVRRCDSRSLRILYNYGANLSDIRSETLGFLESECLTSRCNIGIEGERRCKKTRTFLRQHGI